MMKLNGWTRLWILISAIYLVIVIVVLAFEFPSTKDISPKMKYFLMMKKESKRILLEDSESKNKVTMENGFILSFPGNSTKETINKITNEYSEILQHQANKKRWKYIRLAAIIWFVPCFLLYLLGFSVAWVRNGFKQ